MSAEIAAIAMAILKRTATAHACENGLRASWKLTCRSACLMLGMRDSAIAADPDTDAASVPVSFSLKFAADALAPSQIQNAAIS